MFTYKEYNHLMNNYDNDYERFEVSLIEHIKNNTSLVEKIKNYTKFKGFVFNDNRNISEKEISIIIKNYSFYVDKKSFKSCIEQNISFIDFNNFTRNRITNTYCLDYTISKDINITKYFNDNKQLLLGNHTLIEKQSINICSFKNVLEYFFCKRNSNVLNSFFDTNKQEEILFEFLKSNINSALHKYF